MILTQELKGIMAAEGFSQRQVAQALGMSDKTFYKKMKRGVFKSNEMEKMIALLHIQNPGRIFFA